MCLGIPGQIVAIINAEDALATVEVAGVRRPVNISFVMDDRPIEACVGDWVLVHVGFAMSRIDADEAARTLALLAELGEMQAELEAMQVDPTLPLPLREGVAGGERGSDLVPTGMAPSPQPPPARGRGRKDSASSRTKLYVMKYVDEFRDPAKAQTLVEEIKRLLPRIPASRRRPLQVMEVCGGHTHTIFRYGIQQMLPDEVEFVHGPGCPVCVLPMGRVDDCVSLAERPEVIFTTFGDAMRVPGSRGSLLKAKADGADVRMVYSPLDALAIARKHPDREVVFFGLGFETTMPSTAMTLIQARKYGISNFSLFCNHITIIPTIKAILDSPDLQLDGFVGPGHVSMVIGTRPYEFIARDYGRPVTIAGFEPLDLLQSTWMVLKQLADGRCEIENQYGRIVPRDGNPRALAAVGDVFELREHFEWRGLGSIEHSGVRIRDAYAAYDAERKFAVPNVTIADPSACQCGEVLKGLIKPHQCRVFGTACTPETPLGALMVSTEGACAAYYSYGRQPVHA